ncbi:hypothetical protein [Rubinisphaera sp.]|uniref:hypothetical protein n=1 Tax=Rubinisphaera sp. TaxID=2024857 RepID=UPI000C0EA1D1|nr:hypothetical protein [Rubinisphaera sp.]MBV10849.1 hypothetical protein [Rubinisphaera sp.]|tara:strand:- start:223 stop:555 length:333 start_codon:yes stop_codon:yes gene_type:complete
MYYRASLPFMAAERFIMHIHKHRIEEAKSMIDPVDLEKLPPEYWERIANAQFPEDPKWGISYTAGTLLFSTIAFWLLIQDENGWQRDSSVNYSAVGNSIIIRSTDFPSAQ